MSRRSIENGFRMARAAAVLSALTLAIWAVGPSARAASTERFDWAGAIPAGGVLEIKNVNGEVSVEGGDGREATVQAVKTGRRDDPSRVDIRVVESVGDDGRPHVTVCAVYPGAGNRCAAGAEGRISAGKNDVSVKFDVVVPSGVRVIAGTVNGTVRARDLTAEVTAATVNGSIDVRTTDVARASTVNGSIDAVLGASSWDGTLKFTSVNGSVRVRMPALDSATVAIKTQNGSIDSAWPIPVEGRWVGRRADGTIGGGGGTLEVETVNGNVVLER